MQFIVYAFNETENTTGKYSACNSIHDAVDYIFSAVKNRLNDHNILVKNTTMRCEIDANSTEHAERQYIFKNQDFRGVYEIYRIPDNAPDNMLLWHHVHNETYSSSVYHGTEEECRKKLKEDIRGLLGLEDHVKSISVEDTRAYIAADSGEEFWDIVNIRYIIGKAYNS